MKKVYFSFLVLMILFINGCTASDYMTEQERSTETEVSVDPESRLEEPEGEIDPETHLELVSFADQAPYYTLRFQKIEGGTGEIAGFTRAIDSEDPAVVTIPEHVEVMPSEELGLLTCSFSGDEKPEDALTLSFWNRGNEKTFRIVLDELEYELSLPEKEYEEIKLNQKLEEEGPQAMLNKVAVYPHAILLELSGIDSSHWDCGFWLVDAKTKEIINSPAIFYEKDLEELSLLCVFEDEIPDKDLVLRISEKSAEVTKEKMYHDYDINFR